MNIFPVPFYFCHKSALNSGADPGFDQGGPQIVTGLKLPFWGLSFVEFWCWGLIFGGRGARAPRAPPGSAPEITHEALSIWLQFIKYNLPTYSYNICTANAITKCQVTVLH